MWGKVSCLRKQHDGKHWASIHRPSDLKSNALTTTPPRPQSAKKPEKKTLHLLFPEIQGPRATTRHENFTVLR